MFHAVLVAAILAPAPIVVAAPVFAGPHFANFTQAHQDGRYNIPQDGHRLRILIPGFIGQ
ncbi:MAG: hypothetical protein JWR32_6651 [Mycobacterium sp.]|nr:hypothetical protein [Mycobacterium sp.]